MKVEGLLKLMSDKKFLDLTEEQQQEMLRKRLEVPQYLSIKEKRSVVKEILDAASETEHGVAKVDGIKKYIYLIMYSINAYTNLELSDDIESDYDALCSAGVLARVIDLFDSEYQSVMALLQLEQETREQDDKIELQVARLMGQATDVITELSDIMGKLHITPENVDQIDNIIQMLK
ncbi:MAG: hypothetical protein LUB59_03790 [Candidatus Gastranaerophilales bacterium]|nr:hypothetical protein [Candidatus Gastranaerophilales bacterium]